MPPTDLDPQEADVTLLAVQALTAAQQKAMSSGHSVLVVVNGELIQIEPAGRTVLKKLPPRRKVSVRIKRASS